MNNRGTKNLFIYQVSTLSWFLLFSLVVYQFSFFWSIQNAVAIEYIIVAWVITTSIFLDEYNLGKYPLSVFLIIGFVSTQFYLPLLFTSLEGKPVIYNLELPYEVFFHSFVGLLVITFAHFLYRKLNKYPFNRKKSILIKLNLFTAPTDIQIWLMGFIGLGATVYVYFLSPTIGWEVTGAASDKAVQGLIHFSYAPFFIPFRRLYGKNDKPIESILVLLIIYTVLLFVVSIGRNSRGAFMIGFTSVGFTYALGLLLGTFKPNFFTIKNFAFLTIGLLLLTGPIADIGTAMVIVRDQRNKITNSELIELTMNTFNNKKAIKSRRLADNKEQGDWDERYLNNIFTARFANLKFNDASLVQASKISKQNQNMLDFSINYILGALPSPALDMLDIDANKEEVYGVSIGDYLYYEAGGPREALGGFRTGHFAGTGMAAFGWWYLLLLGGGIIPVYYLFDKLVLIEYDVKQKKLTRNFSLCGLLALNAIFQFLPTESIIITITFIMRTWIQMIFLYIFIYYATLLINNILTFRNLNSSFSNSSPIK